MTDTRNDESAALSGRGLLIVGIYYRPEDTGIAPYTTALAEHLVTRGMRVTMFAGMPHYPRWKIFNGYKRHLTISENLNGVRVRRIRTFIPERQTALRRALYEATFACHLFSLRKSLNPDAILGVVPNLSGGLVAAIASSRFKQPYGLWVQDLTGPAAQQSGISGGSGKVAKLTSLLEGHVFRGASRIAIVSEAFRPYLDSHGIASERIDYLPNWSHVSSPNKDRSVIREELGWDPHQQVVLHAGNMGLKQGLEEVVKAARLVDNRSRVKFVFLGDGSQRSKLEGLSKDLSNLTFIDPVPEQHFANMLSAADVLLLNERASVADMSLPSKLTSYFLSGRPVLAAVSQQGATARFLRDSGAGLLVPADDPASLVEALGRLSTEPELREKLTASAAQFASANLMSSSSLRNFEHFIMKLVEVVR